MVSVVGIVSRMTTFMVIIAKLIIFFFTELVCLIPRCLDKYLKCRVQMYDEYEKYETHNSKYDAEYCLDNREWCEECEYTRYDKRYDEKEDSYDDSSEIEEYHSEVELTRDTDMAQCHTCRESEWYKCSLTLEYDKELGIRKTHIQEECKNKIYSHDNTNRHRVADSEETEKEYIECDNRKRSEYTRDIMYFEYW